MLVAEYVNKCCGFFGATNQLVYSIYGCREPVCNIYTFCFRFRFLSKALASFVLAQLPDMKGEPQTVRRVENAASTVGNPGGNTECVKLMLHLDFGQNQGEIKTCAEMALKQVNKLRDIQLP